VARGTRARCNFVATSPTAYARLTRAHERRSLTGKKTPGDVRLLRALASASRRCACPCHGRCPHSPSLQQPPTILGRPSCILRLPPPHPARSRRPFCASCLPVWTPTWVCHSPCLPLPACLLPPTPTPFTLPRTAPSLPPRAAWIALLPLVTPPPPTALPPYGATLTPALSPPTQNIPCRWT